MVGLRAPWGVEGGVEAAVAELAPRLVRAGCEVTVYCRGRYNPHGSTVREGVRLVDAPTVYSRSLEAFVHSALATPRAALRHDLVHVHACGPALFSGLPRALGRASVVTLHGKDWERDKWGPAARAALRAGGWAAGHLPDRAIGVSRELTDWLAGTGGVPARHVPNGVAEHVPVDWDPGVFPMLRPRRYTLFLGRLVPEKGLDTLLAAVARAKPRDPVVIVGGSAYTPAYVSRLHREAPAGVVFTGPQFGLEKRMLLTHARAFAFPSRVEGLPLSLLEAMAAGLPILASDIRPNAEALGDVGGWRIPAGDTDAWTHALLQLDRTDDALLRGFGARGRQRVRGHFGWDAVVRGTLEVYREALGRVGDDVPLRASPTGRLGA